MKKIIDGVEVEVDEEGEALSQEEIEENAAFEAEFTNTDQEPAKVEPETLQDEEEEKPKEEPEPKETTAATEKPLTLEDLNAALLEQKQNMQRINDKVFGKVGELQQKIDAMKGQASGLSANARARLVENFPELAEMLFDSTDEGTAQVEAPAAAAAVVIPQVPDATGPDPIAFEKRLLKRDHPDWEQVVVSDEFSSWRTSALEPEVAVELLESDDADFISAKLKEFKAWKAAQVKISDKEKERQARLESGLTPSGLPRQGTNYGADDEEAAMMESFGKR